MAKLGGRCPLNNLSEDERKRYIESELKKNSIVYNGEDLKEEFCLKICENFLC